jgi:citrate lyase subunit beta/citryl-CoA lyase
MPAINARAIAKARTLPCDCIILDLEDAVAPEAKLEARRAARAALAEGGFGKRLVVIRVNGLETEWGPADLEALAAASADALLLPKVENPAAITRARQLLAAAGAPGGLALWAMIETPRAILAAPAIAAAEGLEAFVIGVNDLALGLHLPPGAGRGSLETCLALAVLAARAEELMILDGVHNDIADAAGFLAACKAAKALGFDGKSLIHPGQIETANQQFAPDEAQLLWARAVVAGFDAPEAKGKGVITIDGRMVELLHLAEAKRVLALAQKIVNHRLIL